MVRQRHGALVISLDFELMWGMRDVMQLESYRANLEGVHEVVPRILDLFAAYDVHATWACVGLILARDREEARYYAPTLRPSYVRPELSPFRALEDPALDADARCWFAPDLVRRIGSCPDQELATHTYSHFYCTEPGQSAAQFDADLAAAVAISEAHGFRPTSLVFPRNQCNAAYLAVLRRRGIRCYRGVPRAWALASGRSRLGVTLRRAVRLADNYARLAPDTATPWPRLVGAPLDVPGNRFLRPFSPALQRLDGLRRRRICEEMTRAAEDGHVFHLWWHPHNFGRFQVENLAFLEVLLAHARALRESHGFRSQTMAEIAEHDVAA